MRLTAQSVKKIRPEADHRLEVKDDGTPYLRLRVYPKGGKSFVLRYKFKDRSRVMVLGSIRHLSLAEARKRAWRAQRQVTDKDDPRDPATEAQRKRAASLSRPTVAEFAVEYLAAYVPRRSPGNRWRSKPEHERILRREVIPALGRLRIDEVSRRDVQALLDGIAERAPVMANRSQAVLSSLFGFALDRQALPAGAANPASGLRKRGETSRDRVLSDVEIRTLWAATETDGRLEPATRLALRFLALTGQRSGEVCGMERGELEADISRWTLPAARSKNGLTHTVPLPEAGRSLLRVALELSRSERFVFASTRRDGALTPSALRQAMRRIFGGDDPPRVHDLRRTVGTRLGELGFTRLIVDKVLNHKDRTVGGIYDRHIYEKEKRAALTRWQHKLDEIVTGQASAKVVAL